MGFQESMSSRGRPQICSQGRGPWPAAMKGQPGTTLQGGQASHWVLALLSLRHCVLRIDDSLQETVEEAKERAAAVLASRKVCVLCMGALSASGFRRCRCLTLPFSCLCCNCVADLHLPCKGFVSSSL